MLLAFRRNSKNRIQRRVHYRQVSTRVDECNYIIHTIAHEKYSVQDCMLGTAVTEEEGQRGKIGEVWGGRIQATEAVV